MRSILKVLVGLIFVSSVISCNDNDDNEVKSELYDVSGIYNVYNKDASRINVIEVDQSVDLKAARVRLAREGLSVPEGEFYHDSEIYHWADSEVGRILILEDLNGDYAKEDQANTTRGSNVVLSLCSRRFVSPRPSFSFIYCLEVERKIKSDKMTGNLVLHVLKNEAKHKTIKTRIEAYTNRRWSNQYLGEWSGMVEIRSQHRQDLNIVTGDVFNYDLLSRSGRYFIQPLDNNRVIVYKGEKYILHPDEPAILDLEKSTRPYINFRYWSEERGERRLNFNGHFKGAGRLEGNITFYRGKGKKEVTLGTYVMTKR